MESELCMESFKEIPLPEQQELNGGIAPFLAALGIAVFVAVIADWDNFKNGLTGQSEENK
jgi:hypothetical protein